MSTWGRIAAAVGLVLVVVLLLALYGMSRAALCRAIEDGRMELLNHLEVRMLNWADYDVSLWFHRAEATFRDPIFLYVANRDDSVELAADTLSLGLQPVRWEEPPLTLPFTATDFRGTFSGRGVLLDNVQGEVRLEQFGDALSVGGCWRLTGSRLRYDPSTGDPDVLRLMFAAGLAKVLGDADVAAQGLFRDGRYTLESLTIRSSELELSGSGTLQLLPDRDKSPVDFDFELKATGENSRLQQLGIPEGQLRIRGTLGDTHVRYHARTGRAFPHTAQ